MAGLDPSKPFVPLAIAVLTVSDTRDQASDKSGALLQERIEAAGHKLAARALVKDEVKAIRAQVKAWIKDKKIDVVITTGGTGFTGRDVTPEAVEPLFEKRMDGSPGACRDAWDEILVHQLDLRHRPCNFVEILPRLGEHLQRTKAKK